MNPLWREFLASRGARPGSSGNAGLVDFPDPPGPGQRSGIVDLSCLSAVEITGADAGTFLHGQFTCDVAALGDGRMQVGAWCNAKGRVMAVFMLLHSEERYLLLLPREQRTAFARRLQMYVLRADVRISDCDDECVLFGVIAGEGYELPRPGDLGVPAPWQVATWDGMIFARFPDTEAGRRMLVCGELAPMQLLWSRLEGKFVPVTSTHWQLHDIHTGIPWLTPALSEEFLPQELGLEALDGLSLAKGCYPGQEIIARVHYRGRPKRTLWHFTVEADAPPAPATPLYTGAEGTRSAGTVIAAQTVTGTEQAGLAVCAAEAAAQGELRLVAPDGPRIALG